MSSLAASRADNFYFPPDWRPEYGGISKFQGSKGANQYEKYGVIRFELPFDAWCLKCGTHMSKGLRFNAKKDKDGKFFTTQIWKFSMKCYSCDEPFVIKTDPENDTYNYAEGLRKHEQDYEPDEGESHIRVSTDEEKQLLASDPMYRLQHDKEDKVRSQTARERLEGLMDLQEVQTKNDYDANSALRKANRDKRKRASALLNEGRARGLAIPLVEGDESDSKRAKAVMSRIRNLTNKGFATAERRQMVAIQAQSIFSSSSAKNQSTGRHISSSGNGSARGRSSEHLIGNNSSSNYHHSDPKSSKSSCLSSEARKHINLQAAMAKQATLSINPKRLKISDPQSKTGDESVVSIHPRVLPAPHDKVGDGDKGNRSEGKRPSASKESHENEDRRVSGALQMIATYSDDED